MLKTYRGSCRFSHLAGTGRQIVAQALAGESWVRRKPALMY